MGFRRGFWVFWGVLALLWAGAGAAGAQEVTYADLAPILGARCSACHSGDGAAAGLRLDSVEDVLRGSRNGPVVRSGDPEGSELVGRLRGTRQPRMPMSGPPFLSDAEIALFERWVASGLAAGEAPGAQQPGPGQVAAPPAGDTATFAYVAPIFALRCAGCHAGDSAPEGYRLTSYAEALSTADRVRVVPGDPLASELVRRIRGQARPRMPLRGPYLDAEKEGMVVQWVEQGARSAEGDSAPRPVGARVRLHGALGPGWQLDGLPLAVTGSTRIDDAPRPGDYVEVRGRLGPEGEVLAERIRPR